LHNAGVDSALKGRYPEAERFFGEAIRKEPTAAISWVARGISRIELGQQQLAAQDFNYASTLYEQAGDKVPAEQLKKASKELLAPKKRGEGGNGLGSQLLGGAMAAFQYIAPIAIKALGGL
ncbi:MAG: pentapeptide repeat-containing protein, partial [Prochlorococcaceae cyanobacterium]